MQVSVSSFANLLARFLTIKSHRVDAGFTVHLSDEPNGRLNYTAAAAGRTSLNGAVWGSWMFL